MIADKSHSGDGIVRDGCTKEYRRFGSQQCAWEQFVSFDNTGRRIDHYLLSAVKRGFIAGTLERRVLHAMTSLTNLHADL